MNESERKVCLNDANYKVSYNRNKKDMRLMMILVGVKIVCGRWHLDLITWSQSYVYGF